MIKTCIVHNCRNTSNAGTFAGNICLPCYMFIKTGEGKHNQVYWNAVAEYEKAKNLVPGEKNDQ